MHVLRFRTVTYDKGIDDKHFNELNYKHLIDYGHWVKYERDEDIIYDLIQFSKTGISKIGNLQNNDAYRKKRENQRIYLKVSYDDKDKIKNIGGKWDLEQKCWYISKTLYSKNESFINSFCSISTIN